MRQIQCRLGSRVCPFITPNANMAGMLKPWNKLKIHLYPNILFLQTYFREFFTIYEAGTSLDWDVGLFTTFWWNATEDIFGRRDMVELFIFHPTFVFHFVLKNEFYYKF